MSDLDNVNKEFMYPHQFHNACGNAINVLVSGMKDRNANLLVEGIERDNAIAGNCFQGCNIDNSQLITMT